MFIFVERKLKSGFFEILNIYIKKLNYENEFNFEKCY
jgi:hypothetical protein